MATKPLTQTTGRRKEAVARARLRPGNGTHTINGKAFDTYFTTAMQRMTVTEALRVTENETTYDIDATMHGGGISGQAGAVRHGIARALVEANPDLRTTLKREGFLARDARIVERKKAGLHKARKAPQFSKR